MTEKLLTEIEISVNSLLSKLGGIFQILTCLILTMTYSFTDSIIKSCDSPNWLIQTGCVY